MFNRQRAAPYSTGDGSFVSLGFLDYLEHLEFQELLLNHNFHVVHDVDAGRQVASCLASLNVAADELTLSVVNVNSLVVAIKTYGANCGWSIGQAQSVANVVLEVVLIVLNNFLYPAEVVQKNATSAGYKVVCTKISFAFFNEHGG
jgi:hypothetical protein